MRRYAVQRRDLGREQSLEAAIAESSRRLGEALAAPGSSPSEHAGRQELELRLADALSRLPADYAEVILLRNVESLPHEEVARRMARHGRRPHALGACPGTAARRAPALDRCSVTTDRVDTGRSARRPMEDPAILKSAHAGRLGAADRRCGPGAEAMSGPP